LKKGGSFWEAPLNRGGKEKDDGSEHPVRGGDSIVKRRGVNINPPTPSFIERTSTGRLSEGDIDRL